MYKCWFVVFLVLGAVLAVPPASAQQAQGGRIALLIGNSNYPGAAPSRQRIADASRLAGELRRNGFDVDFVENLTKEDMQRALDRFYEKIKPGSAALIFFSGYAIQAGRQNYLVPVNAQIRTEAEVRRDGVGLDTI